MPVLTVLLARTPGPPEAGTAAIVHRGSCLMPAQKLHCLAVRNPAWVCRRETLLRWREPQQTVALQLLLEVPWRQLAVW